MRTQGSALLLAVTVGSAALAGDGSRWIHLRVDDRSAGDSRVDVQLPLTMISAVLPALEDRLHTVAETRHDDRGKNLEDLRSAWQAVKTAQDGDYVTVRDGGDSVRIAKKAGVVLIDVAERGRGGSKVRVRMPVALVDSVLGHGDDVDLSGLARSLATLPNGEIVTIDDDDSHVRIWIDAQAEAARDDAP